MIGDWLAEWNGADQWTLTTADDQLGTEHVTEVFGGSHPDRIDFDRSLQIQTLQPLVVKMPVGNRGGFFLLRDAGGNSWFAGSQKVPLEGASNFRDMGGYQMPAGGQIRWGRLYRSGHLSALSSDDLKHLEHLDLKLICDFRRKEEQSRQPARLPPQNPPRLVSLAITPGSSDSFFNKLRNRLNIGDPDPREMAEFMQAVNLELFEYHSAKYKAMFELILEQESGAVLINCTAGKDRTGFGAALILYALGATRETVLHDYLLTTRYTQAADHSRWMKSYGDSFSKPVNRELLLPILEARAEYLNSALDGIIKQYGSVLNYLEGRLELGQYELGELRRRYLKTG